MSRLRVALVIDGALPVASDTYRSRSMDRGLSSILAIAKPMDLPPLLLAWPAVGLHAQGAGLALRGGLFAAGYALGGFAVQRLGLGGAATHRAECLNHHAALIETDADQQFVADPRLLARFAALATAMHLAALDGGLGQGAGLVEPCGPQPFVQAYLVVFFVVRFVAHCTLDRNSQGL